MLIFYAGVVCAAESVPSGVTDLFREGNVAYEKGEYLKAIDNYERIMSMGYESPAIYFNVANAYFKSGNKGKAILNYERAKKLDPSDSDITANEKYIRSKTGTSTAPAKGVLAWGPVRRYLAAFSADNILIFSSILYILGLGMLAAAMIFRVYGRYFLCLSVGLFVAAVLNLSIVLHTTSIAGKEAVIISPEVESKYGPFPTATVFFSLREGTIVRIIQEKDEWCKVNRSDGKSGWIPKKDLEII